MTQILSEIKVNGKTAHPFILAGTFEGTTDGIDTDFVLVNINKALAELIKSTDKKKIYDEVDPTTSSTPAASTFSTFISKMDVLHKDGTFKTADRDNPACCDAVSPYSDTDTKTFGKCASDDCHTYLFTSNKSCMQPLVLNKTSLDEIRPLLSESTTFILYLLPIDDLC